MKKNLKADQKQFYTEALEIMAKYGEVEKGEFNSTLKIETPFGELLVTVYKEQEIMYCVFMRFLESDKLNHKNFKACFSDICGHTGLNPYSLKWNITAELSSWVLSELEERLDNLVWLRDPENMKEIILK